MHLTLTLLWCNQYRIILCKFQGSEISKTVPVEKKMQTFTRSMQRHTFTQYALSPWVKPLLTNSLIVYWSNVAILVGQQIKTSDNFVESLFVLLQKMLCWHSFIMLSFYLILSNDINDINGITATSKYKPKIWIAHGTTKGGRSDPLVVKDY